MEKYYDKHCGNFCIPVTEYTAEIQHEAEVFLMEHTDYFLMYLSTEDGYEENMWCITNWLE